MTESEERSQICAQINWLQDQQTAASLACVHYLEENQTAKYLEALRGHGAVTREINQLKDMLNEKLTESRN